MATHRAKIGGSWTTISGGDPNTGRTFPSADNKTARPTHTNGDDFEGATINAAWTQRNLAAGHATLPPADPGIRLIFNAQGDGIWRPSPSGDFEIIASFIGLSFGYSGPMVGLGIIDGTGAGVGCSQYNGGLGHFIWALSGYNYLSSGPSVVPSTSETYAANRRYYMSLRKTGTTYTSRYSLDGATWSAFTTGHTWAGTPTQIGIGRFYTSDGNFDIEVQRFNVYPGPTFYVP